ncbi:MAG: acyl-CoA dehydratase activase, partial [Nitrospinota bacterium]
MNKRKLDLGIDVGSVSVKIVLIERPHSVIDKSYTRHYGEPFLVLKKKLESLFRIYPVQNIGLRSFTGTGGKLASELLGGFFVNEVIAQSEAVIALYPYVRTVIEMGGEDSKLLTFEKSKHASAPVINDFTMNTMCSAGTGSFLDQQATRLGVCIEKEFGKMALESSAPPQIAGRCSVFAKSDMIHLQQIGTPVIDIVAGLCFALARSFKSSLIMGKNIKKPILFQGGVAANKGLVKAFETLLDLKDGELIVPEHSTCMGAIGAVLSSRRSQKKSKTSNSFSGFTNLDRYLDKANNDFVTTLPLSHEDNGHIADTTTREIGAGKKEE